MQVTLKTRKPVNKLTPEDLVTFPIWEFASDEEGVEGHDDVGAPRSSEPSAVGSLLPVGGR